MRRAMVSAAVMTLMVSATAWAQCGSSKQTAAKKGCDPAACSSMKTVAQKGDCCGGKPGCKGGGCDLAACSGPKMTYMVAGEKLCCPKNAEILAKAHGTEVKYAVGGKQYCNKGEAMVAYHQALENMLNDMTHVKYAVGDSCVQCPMAASRLAKSENSEVHYRVAVWTFEDKSEAERIAKAALEAANNVHMVTMVGGDEYQCSVSAARASEKSGKQCTYRVGKTETCCKTTAQVKLAEAKLDAARQAIAKVQTGA